MPSTATWFAWLSASMLRRWQAISVSTSKGRKRKSAMNLVTSKSKKLGRASDMDAGSGVGRGSGDCAVHNNPYIGASRSAVKIFFAVQQFRRELVRRPYAPRALAQNSARCDAGERRALPLYDRDRRNRRRATPASSKGKPR